MNSDVQATMSVEEARACIERIKIGIRSIREELMQLYEHRGWQALGYPSWRDCVVEEFGASSSQMYRQLAAGKLEQALNSPIGEHRESHLRPLLSILPDEHERIDAYRMAMAYNDVPLAHHFDVAAKYVYIQQYAPDQMWERVADGELASNTAYEILKAIEPEDDEFFNVAMLCSDPNIIPVLKRLYLANMDTWDEIRASLCIPSLDEQIPLQKATVSSLVAWLSISSNEHRAMYVEHNRAKYDSITACVQRIIKLARDVGDNPPLLEAIQEYDTLVGRQNESSIHTPEGI